MKDFFKNILATVFGNLLTIGIFFAFMLISVIGMALSGSSETTKIKDDTVLVLKLSGEIKEMGTSDPLSGLMGGSMSTVGLNDILSAIDKAKDNDDIKGIYLELGAMSTEYATLQEIRAKLAEFKAAKKWIVAYGEQYMQGAYYVASIADKIYVNPQGSVEWRGMAAKPQYLKDLLAKVGVKMNIVKVGTFKSATEIFSEDHMSDANREQTMVFISGIWDNMVDAVSKSRNISKEKLNEYADGVMMLETPSELKQRKLVDELLYADQVKAEIKKRLALDKDDVINQVSVAGMKSVKGKGIYGDEGDKVAVYYCQGDIVDTEETGYLTGSTQQIVGHTVCADLEKLMKDDKVKAVVLRINSGGGSAYASEQMWHYISELKKVKPVVVSMGGLAASGGYYMSCNASYIFAEPTTITGSIGIFGMFPDMTELLTQKLGIHFDEAKTNKNSSFSPVAMSRPLSVEEKEYLQQYINRGYDLFRKRVADGRKMKVEDVEKIAQGRVWLGQDALRLKLVDQLGTLADAVKKAAQLAKVQKYHIEDYPADADFMQQLLDKATGGTGTVLDEQLRLTLGDYYETFIMVRNIKNQAPVQARIPYVLDIK